MCCDKFNHEMDNLCIEEKQRIKDEIDENVEIVEEKKLFPVFNMLIQSINELFFIYQNVYQRIKILTYYFFVKYKSFRINISEEEFYLSNENKFLLDLEINETISLRLQLIQSIDGLIEITLLCIGRAVVRTLIINTEILPHDENGQFANWNKFEIGDFLLQMEHFTPFIRQIESGRRCKTILPKQLKPLS